MVGLYTGRRQDLGRGERRPPRRAPLAPRLGGGFRVALGARLVERELLAVLEGLLVGGQRRPQRRELLLLGRERRVLPVPEFGRSTPAGEEVELKAPLDARRGIRAAKRQSATDWRRAWPARPASSSSLKPMASSASSSCLARRARRFLTCSRMSARKVPWRFWRAFWPARAR